MTNGGVTIQQSESGDMTTTASADDPRTDMNADTGKLTLRVDNYGESDLTKTGEEVSI